jgi:hypothetical protein
VKGLGGGDPRCLREPLLLSQVIWAIQEGGLKGQVAKGSPPATPGTCALGTNPRWRSCQSRWAVATVPWVSRHDEPTGQPSAAVHPMQSRRSLEGCSPRAALRLFAERVPRTGALHSMHANAQQQALLRCPSWPVPGCRFWRNRVRTRLAASPSCSPNDSPLPGFHHWPGQSRRILVLHQGELIPLATTRT